MSIQCSITIKESTNNVEEHSDIIYAYTEQDLERNADDNLF